MAGKKGQKLNKQKSPRCWEYYHINNLTLSIEECKELACKFNKSCRKICIEYYQRYYPELSEQEQYNLLNKYKESLKSSNYTKIEYWIKKYPNLNTEECEKLRLQHIRKGNYQCIEYYQEHYPELSPVEQEKLLKQAKENNIKKHKSIAGKDNPMHKSKTTLQKRKECSPNSIEFYNKRYPGLTQEEREQMLIKHRENVKNKVKSAIKQTNIEYYINRGMSEEEAKQALHNRQSTFSLEKCIKKYGSEKGKLVWQERQDKWITTLYNKFNKNWIAQSEIAKEFINKLMLKLNITDKNKCTELSLRDNKNKKTYSFDFYYNNILIEFNGDYWHGNPKIYSSNKVFSRHGNDLKITDIWSRDKKKKEFAESLGYKVITIWESDYYHNKCKTIKYCYDQCIKYNKEII